MIAHLLGGRPSTTTGQAAAYDPTMQDGMGDHFGEPNVVINDFGSNTNPTINPIRRLPVPGLRAITAALARTGIPLLPLGPTKSPRMGQGYNGNKNVQTPPKPTTVVQQYVPATSAADAGDWWNYLK